MKKLFLTSLLAIAAIAQPNLYGKTPAWADNIAFTSKAPQRVTHRMTDENNNLKKVTVNFTYDQKNDLNPGSCQEWIRVVSDDYYEEYLLDDYNFEVDDNAEARTVTMVVDVPAQGAFIYLEPTARLLHNRGYLKMVKRVNPIETTTVDFIASEANRRIAYRLRKPDGTELRLTEAHFDPEKNDYVIIQEGNVAIWNASLMTYLNGYYMTFNQFSTDFIDDDEENDNYPLDVWTNYNGEELVISYQGFVIGKQKDEIYGCYGTVNSTVGNTVYNDISTFFTPEINIDENPISAGAEPLYSMNINNFTTTEYQGSIGISATDRAFFDVMKVTKFPDMDKSVFNGITLDITDRSNTIKYSSPVYMDEPEGHFVPIFMYQMFGNSGIDILPSTDYFNTAHDGIAHKLFTGPSVLTCSLAEMPYWKDPEIIRLYPNVINFGYAGDLRLADYESSKWKVTVDGNTLCDNADMLAARKALEEWTGSKPENGTINWTVVSPAYTIGDKASVTTMENSMQWRTSEAITAPTLSALTIRDSEQKVTYELNSVEGATLTIAALANVTDGIAHNGDLVIQPVSITAEYAPAQSDSWKTLDLLTIDNGALQPGLGTVAIASLESVDSHLTEYLDLRITVTDLDGDRQVQTISPALRITAGENHIGNIATESGPATIVYFDLQGRRVVNPRSGLYIRASYGPEGDITYDKVQL